MALATRASSKRKKSRRFSLPSSIRNLEHSSEFYQEQLIAQFIKRRQFLGISQRLLGETIGVTDYQIAKWEGGHRRPTGFLLWCWAESLGIKLVAEITDDE